MGDGAAASNLPVGKAEFKLQSKDLLDFTHGQPHIGHVLSPFRWVKEKTLPKIVQPRYEVSGKSIPGNPPLIPVICPPSKDLQTVDAFPAESVDDLLRNRWPVWS